MRVAATIELNESERRELTRLARSKTASVHLARRAQMVLLVAQGLHNDAIARRLGVGRVQVGRWRSRYLDGDHPAVAAFISSLMAAQRALTYPQDDHTHGALRYNFCVGFFGYRVRRVCG